MPVNGIELKEGQIWEDNVGIRRTINRNPSGSVDFPWIGENTEGGGYSTLTNDGKFNGVDYSYYDLNKLIYNPESEEKTAMTNKFNPQPGDKIICNNGEEFICCTLEFLHETISTGIRSDKPILGYHKSEYDEGWQDWDEEALACPEEYGIREIIPQSLEAPADKKEELKEEPRYSMQEIKEAWDASGWVVATSSWNTFQKNITKINSPEYQEYLRLKAIYE
jgi:hypothetical protein